MFSTGFSTEDTYWLLILAFPDSTVFLSLLLESHGAIVLGDISLENSSGGSGSYARTFKLKLTFFLILMLELDPFFDLSLQQVTTYEHTKPNRKDRPWKSVTDLSLEFELLGSVDSWESRGS